MGARNRDVIFKLTSDMVCFIDDTYQIGYHNVHIINIQMQIRHAIVVMLSIIYHTSRRSQSSWQEWVIVTTVTLAAWKKKRI